MVVLFENQDICRGIISYSENNYLFLGVVNKSIQIAYFNEHGNHNTSFESGMDGISRTEESIESGFRKMLNVYKYAIRPGRFKSVLVLYENRLDMDLRECFIESILHDQQRIFRWVSEKCDKENTYWFNLACQFGGVKFLKILKEMGFIWDVTTTLEAAEFGKLDSLVWLFDNGCPLDERVIVRAAVKGYDDIIVWCSDIIYDPPVVI